MAERANLTVKMTAFVRTFPCLRKASGTELWDAVMFDRWAAATPLSHGQAVTAQFVLALWDPDRPWQSGRFDLMEALRVWDEQHRAAFLTWAGDPWWP